jgi:hypothetical protein
MKRLYVLVIVHGVVVWHCCCQLPGAGTLWSWRAAQEHDVGRDVGCGFQDLVLGLFE